MERGGEREGDAHCDVVDLDSLDAVDVGVRRPLEHVDLAPDDLEAVLADPGSRKALARHLDERARVEGEVDGREAAAAEGARIDEVVADLVRLDGGGTRVGGGRWSGR